MDERQGELLYRYVIAKRRPGKVITLVREPISRNISAFFENFTTFTGVAYEDSGFTTDEIIDIFIREYDHSVPLSWFDVELKKTLGIDIYEHPFPFEAGYATIANGALDLLQIKAETDDPTKERAIAEFLGVDGFKLIMRNVGEQKDYASTYSDFLSRVHLPQSYIDIMCGSDFTRHFYSNIEIETVRSRWNRSTNTDPLPPSVHDELVAAASRHRE